MSLVTSKIATALRGGAARRVAGQPQNVPTEPLVLYEFEGCPMCRRVREALTNLALPTDVRPCPRGGTQFRAEAETRGGKQQFPYLIDPNHDVQMYESADIVTYLYRTYADGRVPPSLTSPLFALTSSLASAVRGGAGSHVRAHRSADQPLRLTANEGDPPARLVRERLCELELRYFRSPGSIVELSDPNLDVTIANDPRAMLRHLDQHYAT